MSELAVEAGLDRNTVARIEKGRAVSVHPRTIRKLAEVLIVEPVALTPENE